MESETTNPYKTPEAAVGISSNGKLSEVFDRFSAWGVFGLSIVTLGFYTIYWLYTRTNKINPHTSEPIGTAFATITVALYCIGAIGNFGELMGLNAEVLLVLALASSIGGIMSIVWVFKIRNRIHDVIGAGPRGSHWFSPVLSFFFQVIYLQYKINCVIDEESE